jgi:hypothetical protein
VFVVPHHEVAMALNDSGSSKEDALVITSSESDSNQDDDKDDEKAADVTDQGKQSSAPKRHKTDLNCHWTNASYFNLKSLLRATIVTTSWTQGLTNPSH